MERSLEMGQMMPGIMIAGVKSGSGKTTVSCALLEALKERGADPCAFKCGPDYIDPMFHREVIGVPSHNLDSFFSGKEQLCEIYAGSMKNKGIAVVEGVMGLYDGLGGIREEGSAYHIASILRLPVLLVADAYGMGRSIVPLLAGFGSYDKEKLIAGVILNRTSEQFYRKIAPVIEEELQLPVLGFLPKKQELSLESRHLGLKLPQEISDLRKKIRYAAELFEADGLPDKVAEIANNRAGKLQWNENSGSNYRSSKELTEEQKRPVRIGVARDEAFCFYYEENLRLLEKNGAELVFFSPLHDMELPEGLDAVLLGGGYPEIYAKQLEQNSSMRNSVRQAVGDGMPSVAECGGFMYLHHSIEDDKGERFHMCGILPGKCFYTGKLVRFGYIELKEKEGNFLGNGSFIKGHEFHYYDSDNNGRDCLAGKPAAGNRWDCSHDSVYDSIYDCIHSKDGHFWGFPHLYYPSNPEFVTSFIEKARFYQKRKEKGIR